MKYKKSIIISVVVIVVFSLIIGAIYFDTHYAVIDSKIYKNNVKYLRVFSLDDSRVREINKCSEIEEMFLSRASEDAISKFINFTNLNILTVSRSNLNNNDCKKISSFNNLKMLSASYDVNINFEGFNNKTVSSIEINLSNIKNLKSLSECQSLEWLGIVKSTVSDNCIVIENGKYVMKDSLAFSSLNNLTFLAITVDNIRDISGILEMDSLETFCVKRDSISEEDVKSLENKGITVTYCN